MGSQTIEAAELVSTGPSVGQIIRILMKFLLWSHWSLRKSLGFETISIKGNHQPLPQNYKLKAGPGNAGMPEDVGGLTSIILHAGIL